MRAGLIGYGYWGPNLLRNISASKGFRITAIAEPDEGKRGQAGQAVDGVTLYVSGQELIDAGNVDVVFIASPVASHFPLARAALLNGKHVFVEKPLCLNEADGENLKALAGSRGLTLMVDHTFLFTGAVKALKKMVEEGELGRLCYYDSMRVNLGLFQPDVNVLWDLAPHDLSVIDYLLGEEPIHIEATGYCHVNPGTPDMVYLTLHYPSTVVAHLNLSWMSPVKVRRVAIGGDQRMIIWDELNREEKLKIYNSGIRFQPEEERQVILPDYRVGDIFSPRVSNTEALREAVEHFGAVVSGQAVSLMDGDAGLRIVRTLERAQKEIEKNLRQIDHMRGDRDLRCAPS